MRPDFFSFRGYALIIVFSLMAPGAPFDPLQAEPSDEAVRTGVGEVPDLEGSLQQVLRSLTRDPGSLYAAKRQIGSLRNRMPEGDIIEAVEEYAARHGRSVAVLSLQSWLYIRAGEMRKALNVLKDLSRRDREAGIAAMIGLAKSCEAAEAFRVGIDTYRAISDLDPSKKVECDIEVAGLLRLAGDSKGAYRMYRSTLEREPAADLAGSVFFRLGEIALYDLHRPEEAHDWFERVMSEESDPERSADAGMAIARIRVLEGDLEGAVSEAERASRIERSDKRRLEIDYVLGIVNVLDGRIGEGRGYLEKVSRKSNHLRANDALEALVRLDRDTSAKMAVSRGLIERRLLAGIEEPARSIERLRALREIADGTPLALDVAYDLAKVYRESGRFPQALELLNEIVTAGSNRRLAAFACWEMADLYRRELEDRDQAKRLLERVILDYGDSVIAPRARRDLEGIEGGGGPK